MTLSDDLAAVGSRLLLDNRRMLHVRALGTAEIDAGELRITPGSPRKFALLLRLAADAGRRVPRVVIRELIFPDLKEKNALHSLLDLI